MKEQMANAVSLGMPTSQGSQYLDISEPPAMSQGWTNTAAPSSSAASKMGNKDGSDRGRSLT